MKSLYSMKINPTIFRESDIRGLVDQDLNPETVELIGKAIGTFIRRDGGNILTIARDTRLTSPEYQEALSNGLLSTGCDLIDLGMLPTPVFYYSLFCLNPHGGVIVTGSHNPPEFNGFKICQGKYPLFGQTIQELQQLIEKGDFENGQGKTSKKDVREVYIQKICSLINITRPIKVVVDGGNGCFGTVGLDLLRRLGLNPIELFCEPDGRFPNHHPDPIEFKNLKSLIQKVRDEKADLGIAFDGDADRIGVVDEHGNIILGDQLLTIFSRDILDRNPGASIIGEVKCSQEFFDDVKNRGGVPIMTPTGHSLIKNVMRESGALLAGEMSGHICFADNYYGYDDAIYAACRLLEILSQNSKSLRQILEDIPQAENTPEIRIDCPEEKKFLIVQELAECFRGAYHMTEIDGVRLIFEDGWALIRASNTQPALTLRFEAKTQERLSEIKRIVQLPMEKYKNIIDIQQIA